MPAALACHAAATLLAGALALRLGRRAPGRARACLAVGLGVLLPAQLAATRWPWWLANTLGGSALLDLVDAWGPLAALVGTSAVLAQPAGPARARTAVLGVALLAAAAAGAPGLRAPAPLEGVARVSSGVVLQAAASSCAPAAAATLVRALGLDPAATEADLARLCGTDPRRGTSDLGLFRGLRRAAPGRRVRFVWPGLDGLRARAAPCLVVVGLDLGAPTSPALRATLRDACGWDEGVEHAVVFFGFAPADDGREVAVIGDPRFGLERWPLGDFAALWSGRALVIE